MYYTHKNEVILFSKKAAQTLAAQGFEVDKLIYFWYNNDANSDSGLLF